MKPLPQTLLALTAMSGVRPSPGAATSHTPVLRYFPARLNARALLRPRTGALRPLFASTLLLAFAARALPAVHYVDLNSTNATPPYTNWATAATNIQDAVDAAVAGDEIVVTNGIYATGGRAISNTINRVAVDKLLNLRSVNGPQFTVIDGGHSNRCVYLTNSASLSGFTLTNGAALSGGGVLCESASAIVSNCVVTGNSAFDGGGAYQGTLNNCTLSENLASGGGGALNCVLKNCTLTGNAVDGNYGGGASICDLINCTLTHNAAFDAPGGGAYGCNLNNCTVTDNYGVDGSGVYDCQLANCIVYFNNPVNYYYSILDHCCTTPYFPGSWCFTNEPLFVDQAGGNLRLQSNSPCIDAGDNLSLYLLGSKDLDGRPRLIGDRVDVGAYEFQPEVSGAFIGWLQQYGLPTDGSADFTDPDGDAVDNYHEWLAGTNPTNSLSSPAHLTITPSGVPPSAIILTWSTNAVGFTLQSTTNLLSPAAWVTNSTAPVVIAGQNTVTNPITGAQRFYRLIND